MTPTTASLNKSLRVVAVQHAAGSDVAQNLADLTELLPAPGTADLAVLPEVFACRGPHEVLRRSAEPLDGLISGWLTTEAARRNCWILGGSFVEREGDRLFNTSILVDRQGCPRATYRKIHLFDAALGDGRAVRESDVYTAGDTPAWVDIEGWRCGLSICYDLRFPELYRRYQADGATLLLVPSDFLDATGRTHWEVLVRARAIENQCFVVAPNQCGINGSGAKSHGHSLIVDPWGQILAQADTVPTALQATLDPALKDTVRQRLPAWRHRRL